MSKRLIFDMAPQHLLVVEDGGKALEVHGGESFTVSDDTALELLTNPGTPTKEDLTQLKRMSRADLEIAAEEVGLPDGGNRELYPTKEDLAGAIEEFKTNPQLPQDPPPPVGGEGEGAGEGEGEGKP